MEFNCEGQNGGNNGGIMMYNYGVDHRELCGQFFVLTLSPNTSKLAMNWLLDNELKIVVLLQFKMMGMLCMINWQGEILG